MKQLTIFLILFISSFSYSQTKEDTLKKVFEYIRKVDHLYTKEGLIPDNGRNLQYKANLELIGAHIEKGDLSVSSMKTYDKKVQFSIRAGFDITFIHVLKYCPEFILNEEFISFIETQVQKDNVSKANLKNAIAFHFYNMTYYDPSNHYKAENPIAKKLNHKYDSLFYEAIKRWGIDREELQELIKHKQEK